MTTYHEFCRLRDLHTPGANAPKHTEADAFFMAACQLAVPEGHKLVPLEPTPEIIAGAAVAIWPSASPADIALALQAAPIVLMQMDMAPGTTADVVAGMLATMAPAYRAMLAAAPAAPAQAQLAAASNESFQARVQPWMRATFGPEIPSDRAERNHRFLEESLELVQACGCTASEAHQLVDYVFGRPVGERTQEVGGVMVTLAALCLAQGLDMHVAGETELARIWTKVKAIRSKHAAKPKHSPLPAAAPQAVADERAAFEKTMNDSRFLPAELNFIRVGSPSGRDEYANSHLQSNWLGWQARAALAAGPAQAQVPVIWYDASEGAQDDGKLYESNRMLSIVGSSEGPFGRFTTPLFGQRAPLFSLNSTAPAAQGDTKELTDERIYDVAASCEIGIGHNDYETFQRFEFARAILDAIAASNPVKS